MTAHLAPLLLLLANGLGFSGPDELPPPLLRSTITRAIDGDSAIVEVATGLDVVVIARVRFTGYNAPELRGPHADPLHGPLAREYLISLAHRYPLYLQFSGQWSFERRLAKAFVLIDGQLVPVAALFRAEGWDR